MRKMHDTKMWKYTGERRPPFAKDPGPGQESVWDYPRPPRADTDTRTVEVYAGDELIARSSANFRLKETASPPTFYLPADSVDWQRLIDAADRSICEWKGLARYFALAADPGGRPVAWRYDEPSEHYAMLAGHVSFYPGRVACYVDGERVEPQPGEFYGGWVTNDVVGPFKGEPGTGHW